MSPYDYLVVVSSGSFVAAARIHHGDEASIVVFHVAIRKSQLAQQFNTSHLEPYEMIRVINHSHLIGFCVPYSDSYFAPLFAQCPLHRGLRFSRNEVMPSRKSSVCRMPAFSSIACSNCSSSVSAMNPFTSCFVSRKDVGLFSPSCAASARARACSWSAATTSFTNPNL